MKVESYICDRCGEEIKDNIFLLTPECVDRNDGETLVGIPDDISNELYALMQDRHLCLKCTKDVLKMVYKHSAIPDERRCLDDKCKTENDEFISLMKKYASEGRTIRELQDATGASYSKINNAAIRHGVKFKKHKSRTINLKRRMLLQRQPILSSKHLARMKMSHRAWIMTTS